MGNMHSLLNHKLQPGTTKEGRVTQRLGFVTMDFKLVFDGMRPEPRFLAGHNVISISELCENDLS